MHCLVVCTVDFAFRMLSLTENIGHRAAIYIEEYGLKAGMRMADALIAARLRWRIDCMLYTGDHKYYKLITDIETKIFRP